MYIEQINLITHRCASESNNQIKENSKKKKSTKIPITDLDVFLFGGNLAHAPIVNKSKSFIIEFCKAMRLSLGIPQG